MELDFSKYSNLLIPVIIQDHLTHKVLMLGFMNAEALHKTQKEKKVTFFSRTKNRLWTKGEESGNFLYVKEILPDCDKDTLLIKVQAVGPVCHTGADTCFNEKKSRDFLFELERLIASRKSHPKENSYTSQLFAKGINKIAQKVGEEAVELVIEAKDNDKTLFLNESADLLFHYLILLHEKNFSISDVINILEGRHKK